MTRRKGIPNSKSPKLPRIRSQERFKMEIKNINDSYNRVKRLASPSPRTIVGGSSLPFLK